MIAFVQPFGLNDVAGAPKLLRGLLQASHPPVISINTGAYSGPPLATMKEIYIPLRRSFGRIERTRFHPYFGVFDGIFQSGFEGRLRTVLLEHQVKLIHTIPHTYDIVPISRIASELRIPTCLSIHDDLEYTSLGHPLMGRMVKAMAQAWSKAQEVFAISDEIGHEYSRRFGARRFQVVTDGLTSVAAFPQERPARSLRIYFMGLFHFNYGTNLRALLDALKIIRNQHPDWDISVTCRCGILSCPIQKGDVPVIVFPFAPNESVVGTDMLAADLLYQPLPFEAKAASFGKFSMSTKLVTYLGSGLPTLYHGPRDAAACNLLTSHHAAVVCTTLDSEAIAGQLIDSTSHCGSIVKNALALARSRFMLADQQRRFWQPILAAL